MILHSQTFDIIYLKMIRNTFNVVIFQFPGPKQMVFVVIGPLTLGKGPMFLAVSVRPSVRACVRACVRRPLFEPHLRIF